MVMLVKASMGLFTMDMLVSPRQQLGRVRDVHRAAAQVGC